MLALGIFLAAGWSAARGDTPPRLEGPTASAPAEGVSPPRQRHVLLLYTEPRLTPAIVVVDQVVRSILESGSPGPVYFYTEYLDLSLFDGDEPQRELRVLLKKKYAHRPLDLVMAAGSRALRVALHSRAELFGGAPIVFTAVDRAAAADLKLDDRVTGTWLGIDWSGTLEAALRLQPGIRRAVVVAGTSTVDRVWLTAAREQLATYQGRVEITYVTDLSIDDLRSRIAALPPQTVLLVGTFFRDARGRQFNSHDATRQIAETSPVPTYGLADTLIGTGIVGGHVISFEAQGAAAAKLALEILHGLSPVPISAGTNVFMFDWRQLRRWKLDLGRLPPGSVIRFREPSVWELYKGYIVGAGTLLVLQTALIAGLLVNRAQRRRAQRALAERLRFETLLSELSATLGAQPTSELDHHIDGVLRRMVDALALDRATVAAFDHACHGARITHSATRDGIDPIPKLVSRGGFPWIQKQLRAGEVVCLTRISDVPDEATTDWRDLVRFGTRSLAVVPLVVGGSLVGALSFSTLRAEREWPEELVQRLRLLGEVVANALARQQAEHAVRESEERFRRMADSAPVMVWLAGPDARRTYVNRQWLDVTGRPLEDELGDGWLTSIHPDDREASAKIVHEALAERRPFTMEYQLLGGDGQYRSVLEHGVPRLDDDGVLSGYVGSAIDVTELRATQVALAESDALRSAIFGSLYGRVAALDRAGVILAVNQAWPRFAQECGVGPSRSSVGDNYLDAYRRAAAEGDPDAARALKAILAVRDGDVEQTRIEYSCQLPSDVRWFSMMVAPFRRPEGGVIVSHVDITRRRQVEEEARQQREELAHVLRVTTLGELAGSLAHEINQPLSAIVTNAQATRRLLEAGPAEEDAVREALVDIADDAKRAAQIIRRLRALFRKEHADRREVDVNALIKDVVDLLRTDLQRKRIAVRCTFDSTLPTILGDPVQLQQVMLNLLVNACEAIAASQDGPREIAIGISQRAPRVVAVAVRDTGIGVKEGERERIFEHFVTSKPNGLGMGLAISRSIIRAHGGSIWAAANAERGLTIHVELPCDRPPD